MDREPILLLDQKPAFLVPQERSLLMVVQRRASSVHLELISLLLEHQNAFLVPAVHFSQRQEWMNVSLVLPELRHKGEAILVLTAPQVPMLPDREAAIVSIVAQEPILLLVPEHAFHVQLEHSPRMEAPMPVNHVRQAPISLHREPPSAFLVHPVNTVQILVQ